MYKLNKKFNSTNYYLFTLTIIKFVTCECYNQFLYDRKHILSQIKIIFIYAGKNTDYFKILSFFSWKINV